MRIAGGWAWRIVAIAAAAVVILWPLTQISLVVIPLLVAALLTSLMLPGVEWLIRHGWPRVAAVTVSVLGSLALITALMWLSVYGLRSGYPALQVQALEFWNQTKQWLLDSPLHVSDADLTQWGEQIADAVSKDMQSILSSAWSVGSTFGHVVTGAVLAVFCTIFMLLDGQGIWKWIVGLFPRRSRIAIDVSARAGWVTLGNFMRVQVVVAGIDAAGIGIGALILGLPMVGPITILVFLGSFIPVVGAVLTGTLAVLIALITGGVVKALIMLGIVLLVQQLEGHVLQPLIMGNAVSIHPLAIVLAVTTGSLIAGIPGALFAVPIAAFLNVFVGTIADGSWRKSHKMPNGGATAR